MSKEYYQVKIIIDHSIGGCQPRYINVCGIYDSLDKICNGALKFYDEEYIRNNIYLIKMKQPVYTNTETKFYNEIKDWSVNTGWYKEDKRKLYPKDDIFTIKYYDKTYYIPINCGGSCSSEIPEIQKIEIKKLENDQLENKKLDKLDKFYRVGGGYIDEYDSDCDLDGEYILTFELNENIIIKINDQPKI